MKFPEDIKTYAKIRSGQKLFQFLNGLDRKFEPIKQEILRVDPLPTAEDAYATVRKEATHQNILGATNNEPQSIATGLITGKTKGVGFDIRTGWIIRRGIKREGLYYVDEVTTSGTVMLAHRTSEREAWLWHRRLGHPSGEQYDTLSWLRYTLEESCLNQNNTSAGAQEQSSPNISATEDTVPNLISEVSNSQPSDSLVEIPENIHETIGVQEHEEPTLTEVKEPTLTEVSEKYVHEKYVLPARSNRGIPPKRYTPEKTSRSSKYLIANIARGNLSKEAKALFAIAKIDTIRVLFSIAANQAWHLHQFDVKNAFLHGDIHLSEKVYTRSPSRNMDDRLEANISISYSSRYSICCWSGESVHAPTPGRSHACSFKNCQISRGNHQSWSAVQNKWSFKYPDFTDADWAGDKRNRRSTSEYFSLVGGNLVTWKSKKQKVVSLSSAEAEFRGIAKGLAEALWIKKLVSEIGFPPKESIRIMSDNKVIIQISENHVQHDKTKHVEVDRHFIKEKLEAEIIKLPKGTIANLQFMFEEVMVLISDICLIVSLRKSLFISHFCNRSRSSDTKMKIEVPQYPNLVKFKRMLC
nr:putative copia-type protein [Tanacetum cinerariifolium]